MTFPLSTSPTCPRDLPDGVRHDGHLQEGASDQCDFVVDNCDDPGASTFGSYLELFHCGASAALSLL